MLTVWSHLTKCIWKFICLAWTYIHNYLVFFALSYKVVFSKLSFQIMIHLFQFLEVNHLAKTTLRKSLGSDLLLSFKSHPWSTLGSSFRPPSSLQGVGISAFVTAPCSSGNKWEESGLIILCPLFVFVSVCSKPRKSSQSQSSLMDGGLHSVQKTVISQNLWLLWRLK